MGEPVRPASEAVRAITQLGRVYYLTSEHAQEERKKNVRTMTERFETFEEFGLGSTEPNGLTN